MSANTSYTLLIADDEAMERKALSRIVSKRYKDAVKIVEAANGLDALEKIGIYKPDIIFCDIKMPGKSGLEVIREIKKKTPEQIAVFLSAYDYFEYAREAVSLGVQEYLLKPVSDEEVCTLMRTLLEKLEKKRLQEQGTPFAASSAAAAAAARATDSLSGKRVFSARLEKLLKDAAALLESNYKEEISLDGAARRLKLSRFYFSKMFKLYWGKSFTDYLNEVRICRACKMLEDPALSIKEIAALCGFSNSNYFSRVFKQCRNLTPGEWRSNILN